MKNKVGRNLAYNLIYQILILLLPLITSPYISRVMGAEGIGIYSYVSSIAYYFLIFINLGLANYGNRSIARVREDEEKRSQVFCSIQGMQILVGIPVLIIYFLCCFFVFKTTYQLYFIIYGLYVLSAVFDINWFYFGMGEFKISTIRSIIVRTLTFVSVFVFVKTKEDLIIYIFIMAISFLISSISLWLKLKKYVKFVKPSLKSIVKHFFPNLILFIPILAMSIYRVMDKIMITALSNEVETGYYQNADSIVTMSLTFFSAIATVMLPEISNLAAKNQIDLIKRSVRDIMQIGLCFSIAISFGLAAIGIKFAPIFWGEEFIQSGYIIVALSIVPIITEWKNVLRSQYLIPCGKDKGYAISLVIGAILNVIFNIIFIPKYGALGAVIGTIVAEISGAIYQTLIVRKELPIHTYLIDCLPFLFPGIIMFVTLRLTINIFPDNILGIFFSIIQGLIVYIVTSILVMYLTNRKRLKYYISFIRKKKKN